MNSNEHTIAIKVDLIKALAFGQPKAGGEFVLDLYSSTVAIAGLVHLLQGPDYRWLRPVVFGFHKLIAKFDFAKLRLLLTTSFRKITRHCVQGNSPEVGQARPCMT